jgi:hypothetical protein
MYCSRLLVLAGQSKNRINEIRKTQIDHQQEAKSENTLVVGP